MTHRLMCAKMADIDKRYIHLITHRSKCDTCGVELAIHASSYAAVQAGERIPFCDKHVNFEQCEAVLLPSLDDIREVAKQKQRADAEAN